MTWWADPPVLIGGAAAAGLAVDIARRRRRRPRAAVQQGDQRLRAWAVSVQRELPLAWPQLKLTHAQPGSSKTPPPRPLIHAGQAIPDGWRWRFSTPGAVTIADLEDRADRLASALNTRHQLVGALEIARDRRHEGWGTLSVWRRDPLENVATVPWEPGRAAPCVRPGWVCWGVHRDGSHVHAPLIGEAGAICALFAGRRGSGKSVGMLNVAAHLASWGWAAPILIDTVRQGADLAVLEPIAATPVITDPKDALEAIKAAASECRRRARVMRERGWRKMPGFSSGMPLLPVVADEIHALMSDKKIAPELTKYAQETRAMGGCVIGATQYPLAMSSPQMSTFRQQMAYRVAYRCSNADEGRVILGSTPEGEGPHLLRTGPGSCMADLDGSGVVTMRSWWVPDAWLRQHVETLKGGE